MHGKPSLLQNHEIRQNWPKEEFWRSPDLTHLTPVPGLHSQPTASNLCFTALQRTSPAHHWDVPAGGNPPPVHRPSKPPRQTRTELLKHTEAARWKPAPLAEDFQCCTQRGYKRQATDIDLSREEETTAKTQWKNRQMHTPGSRAAAQLVNVTGVRKPLSCGKAISGRQPAAMGTLVATHTVSLAPLPRTATPPQGSPWTGMS